MALWLVPIGNQSGIAFSNAWEVPPGNEVSIDFAEGLPVPVAINETYSLFTQQLLEVPAPGFLSNDTLNGADVELITLPLHGDLVFNENGSFQYQSDSGFSGDDTWSYRLINESGTSIATVTMQVESLPAVVPLLQTSSNLPWGGGSSVHVSSGMEWSYIPRVSVASMLPWTRPSLIHTQAELVYERATPVSSSVRMTWGRADSVRVQSQLPWTTPDRVRVEANLPWSVADPVATGVGIQWRTPTKRSRRSQLRWGKARSRQVSAGMPAQHPPLRGDNWWLPWKKAQLITWKTPHPGVDPPDDVDPDSPWWDVPEGNKASIPLACLWYVPPGNEASIPFSPAACYAVRPRDRTYIVINDITVVRLPERTPIAVSSLGISTNIDNLYWELSNMALSDPSQLAYLLKDSSGPKEVEVNINGHVWTFIIDMNDDNREFNTRQVSVSGRSRTAYLAEPSAPKRSFIEDEERTSWQLMDQELFPSFTEFSITHNELSWTVPAESWFYDSLTPIEAIRNVAQASGSFVRSHTYEKELEIFPRFPVSPWYWSVTEPDKIVADDYVRRMTYNNQSIPVYNYVFVSGTTPDGVGDPITRTGSAGDIKKEMVTHQLITDHTVALERGRNELSDRGEQSHVSITLPLFPAAQEPGLVQVGELVQYLSSDADWKGLNVGTSIDVTTDQNGTIQVWMTITLERHYTDEG